MKIESKTEIIREEATDLYGWSYIFRNVSLFHDDILIDTRKYIDGRNEKLEGFMTVEITLNEAYFLENYHIEISRSFLTSEQCKYHGFGRRDERSNIEERFQLIRK